MRVQLPPAALFIAISNYFIIKTFMEEMRSVTLASIDANPWQPREEFEEDELDNLADSIREHGIIQPLVVTAEKNGRYRLIAGERRLRAAKKAGLNKVFVIVRKADEEEQLELALVENIQRKDLNPIEKAKAYRRLMDEFSLTQAEVAEKVGKTRPSVANTLRMLDLPEDIKKAISVGQISEGHARVIAGLPKAEQHNFFDRVVKGNFSVRDTEEAGRKIKHQKIAQTSSASKEENLAEHYRGLLESVFGTKVEIANERGQGHIKVEFYSEEELQEVVRKMLNK